MAIEDVQTELDAVNTKLAEALPVVANISADIDNLTAQIAALVAGSLTPEQLANLTNAADSLNTNASALADALKTVDDKTPPA